MLNGNKVHFVPGWDCHGLPIELKAIADSTGMDPIEIRNKGRNFAQQAMVRQEERFKSWGVIGDWKNAYTTYSPDYVKTQFRQFLKLYNKKLIFRDVKPVYWSPSTKTALAEAELEYNENHTSPSVYLRLKVKNIPKVGMLKGKRVYAIIWTTTPWSLPSNQALCYNEKLYYHLVKKEDPEDNSVYIVASKLLCELSSLFRCTFTKLKVVSGDMLEGATYVHPINKDTVLPFLNSSHATATKGTGLVHTAPAHGYDDFLVGLHYKLKPVDLVNDDGCFTKDAGKKLEGKYVLTDGVEAVLDIVRSNVMHLGEITHSYPYDWRTKQPIIIRLSRQWFIDTDAIKDKAVSLIFTNHVRRADREKVIEGEALENVKIYPSDKSDKYKNNLIAQIQKRPYWCISRQRKWGVPIPVLYDKNTSEIIINENLINHNCNLLDQHGTDFWWKLKPQDLVPENEYSSSKLTNMVKGEDIMDIWFDSGISWAKVLDGEKVADLYLEGVDQFSGWFQSSLLTSVASRNKAPYKSIYVHGFAVDRKGLKMSKSLGNVIDPYDIATGNAAYKAYGIDVLRWWVTCHASQVSLANVSTNVLQTSAEQVQKIRSILRFALSCLSDYEMSDNDYKSLLLIDRYMLHIMHQFHQQITEFVRNYQFHKVSSTVLNLITNSISGVYYTAIKDRLYCEHVDSSSRRAAQYVLLQIFEIVSQAIGPIVPHLVEEMYIHLLPKDKKTYFTSNHVKPIEEWHNSKVEKAMELVLSIRKDVNKELDATLDADVTLTFSKQNFELFKDLVTISDLQSDLADILQVAEVNILEDENISEAYKIGILRSKKFTCLRCRRMRSEKRIRVM
ncbi:hypothetical protein NQ317_012811 [Molorchus minor]|uniref:isoleucine--tRNA ligase n=1 Tax=Molorchus minor TaxID=1323400 RepID=A0ABQ9K4A8_9CUCU|nr:hypothetical protein NQ317_012811 [Molorchus minor]